MEDEIVIGIETKSSNTSKKKKTSKRKNKKNNNSKNKNSEKKTISSSAIVKFFIFILIAVAIVLFLSSPLFNISKFEVVGNELLSEDKIVSLSSLEYQVNIFNFSKSNVINKIKENAYVESVKIKRKLPGTIQIEIKERTPKYMLQFADSFVYINNQGYMLEISNEKIDVPILLGFATDLSNIKAGNRIDVKDLEKMDVVIKIYEAAKSNELGNLITKIDISNDKNYTLILEKEGKIVYLGDGLNLNTKILYLKSILEASSGKSGEIFLNVDLNTEKVYFRPSSI